MIFEYELLPVFFVNIFSHFLIPISYESKLTVYVLQYKKMDNMIADKKIDYKSISIFSHFLVFGYILSMNFRQNH